MPALLLAAGLALAVYAGVIRTQLAPAGRTTVSAPPAIRTAQPPRASKQAKLVITKQTTTTDAPSDALLGVLFGTAGVLALSGAFYSRITKITLPGGGGVELTALGNDLQRVETAVPDEMEKQIAQLPPERKQALRSADIARITSRAWGGAQRAVLATRLSAVHGPAPPAPAEIAPPRVESARAGMPLPDELINRLVTTAVGDALDADASARADAQPAKE